MAASEYTNLSSEKISQVMRARWCYRAGKLGADGFTTGRLVQIVDDHAVTLFELEATTHPRGGRLVCNNEKNSEGCQTYWSGVKQMREIFEQSKYRFTEAQWSPIACVFSDYFGTGNDIAEPMIEYRHESPLSPQAAIS